MSCLSVEVTCKCSIIIYDFSYLCRANNSTFCSSSGSSFAGFDGAFLSVLELETCYVSGLTRAELFRKSPRTRFFDSVTGFWSDAPCPFALNILASLLSSAWSVCWKGFSGASFRESTFFFVRSIIVFACERMSWERRLSDKPIKSSVLLRFFDSSSTYPLVSWPWLNRVSAFDWL